MDFEEEQEEELSMPPPSYEDSRVKMPCHQGQEGDQPPPAAMAARNSGKGRYRECLKNHALGIGGHALDGCCEFMAAGADGTIDALKCAACNCHRNFHRKETIDTTPPAAAADPYLQLPHHHHHPHNNPYLNRHHQAFPQFAACYRAQGAGYLHVAGQQTGAAAPATLALPSISGGGGGTQSTRDEEHEDVSEPSGGAGGGGSGGGGGCGGGGGGSSSSKKRHRTKFTQEQKDKMLDFAERLGWRIQKHDEVAVQEFCDRNGVKRHVFKVWMHNNKHTLGKKP